MTHLTLFLLSSKYLATCFCVGLGLLACFPMMIQVLISISWPKDMRDEEQNPVFKRGFLQENLISLLLAIYFIIVVSVSACLLDFIDKMSE